jgi:heterodisulfide reductase subunit D
MSTERVVFWYGCNAVRHGDIIRHAIDLLRAAGVEPEPAGGPSYCCGTQKDDKLHAAEGMAKRTVGKFNAFETGKVVSWCPSCYRHMNSFMGQYTDANFSISHFVQILHANRERLTAAFTHPVPRRVLLHKHVGFREVPQTNRYVADLLRLVPGLTLIESDYLAPGHMCSALASVPAAGRDVARRVCEDARAGGVDDVATVFHSCQRLLCGLEGTEPFRVVNYVALLGAAMGREYPDDYRDWKLAGNEAEIRERVGAGRIARMGERMFETALLPELKRRPEK